MYIINMVTEVETKEWKVHMSEPRSSKYAYPCGCDKESSGLTSGSTKYLTSRYLGCII